MSTMKVAIEGCCHGSLPQIYNSIAEYERTQGAKVDVLLLCGDFQAIRNTPDMNTLSCPPKYRALGTFNEYYSGKRVAPLLTIVIGGNHEASGYMWELYHGGWLAPNIYYLGGAGSVLINGLRVSGVSGIFSEHDFKKGHFENVPFTDSTLRSVYHIRKYDTDRVMKLPRQQPTAIMSHDWPTTIAHYGDTKKLLKRKPFFKGDLEKNELGAPPFLDILKQLRPDYWFAAHHHVKFPALVDHPDDEPETQSQTTGAPVNPDEIAISDDEDTSAPTDANANPDEINIDDEEFEPPAKPAAAPVAPKHSSGAKTTQFLALDKPGHGHNFLQFLDLPAPEPSAPGEQPRLCFDPYWLAITRVFHPYLETKLQWEQRLPADSVLDAKIAEEYAKIRSEGVLVPKPAEGSLLDAPPLVRETGPVEVSRVQQFWMTAPPEGEPGVDPTAWYTNPQTEAFCGMLELENKVNPRPEH